MRLSLVWSFGIAGAIILLSFALFPLQTRAAGASTMANITCAKCVTEALQKKQNPQTYCKPRVCVDTTNGVTTGHCEMTECHADKFSGAGQSGGAGLDQVMKALGDLFGKLMSQPKPPEQPPQQPPINLNPTGCQGTRFPTHDVSLISNPCADWTPDPIVINPTTTDTGCTPLMASLNMCTKDPNNCPDVPIVDCAPGYHPVSGGEDANGCVLRDSCVSDSDTTPTSTPPISTPPIRPIIFATTTTIGGLVVPKDGAHGDINTWASGATIVGGTRDVQNNVEVAGFYGSETFNGQGTTLVGTWCKDRPWATNFLAKIIAPSFFDGLCTWRGYQVGAPPPAVAPTVTLQQSVKPKPATTATTTASSTPKVAPKVDIWAVPVSVPLGARTYIYWNTQGVTNCMETSPNGGFNQSSLSGGAATQPITAATTFSISCLAPDGSHVTGSVTVNLKI